MSSNDYIQIRQLATHRFNISHRNADTCEIHWGGIKYAKTLEDAVKIANKMKDKIRKEVIGGVEYGIEISLMDRQNKGEIDSDGSNSYSELIRYISSNLETIQESIQNLKKHMNESENRT